MSKLTHFDSQGQAHMVNIANKPDTERKAKAGGLIALNPLAFEAIVKGTGKKGDVLGVARIAAIQAAKRTFELIPLCHAVPLTHLAVEFELQAELGQVLCVCTAHSVGKTGVEMEALMGVQIALLTIYDMLKAIDKHMVIDKVSLIEKTGGTSSNFENQA